MNQPKQSRQPKQPRQQSHHTQERRRQPREPSRPRMRLTGVLDEAVRNLATGTSHACGMALTLAFLLLLCAGADLLAVTRIQREADAFVAAGGSTTVITYTGRIDGTACDRLASLDGVIAAGATRASQTKLTFAALPSTGVPTYEATPGAIGVFRNSTTGGRAARPTTVSDVNGVWLSGEAAAPLAARAGSRLALRDERTLDVAGVYEWPDDGRQSGYSYAAVTPVPAGYGGLFDQCWVKSWPIPENIESLLRVTTVGDATGTQERPMVSQLNTSRGRTFDTTAMYRGRLTVWAPIVAGVGALLAGFVSIWRRRLELASALHCGVPKPAMVVQTLVETAVWALAATLMSVVEFTWTWMENTATDAAVLTTALLRVPAAGYAGVMTGALIGAMLIRERHLFRYFKTR